MFEFRATRFLLLLIWSIVSDCSDFWQQRSLASYGVTLVDGIRFQVPFLAAVPLFGTGLQNQEHIPMVSLDAIVTAHGEEQQREHEDIQPLPAGRVNICGIAKSAFHGSPSS
jgi:hypothetical protein